MACTVGNSPSWSTASTKRAGGTAPTTRHSSAAARAYSSISAPNAPASPGEAMKSVSGDMDIDIGGASVWIPYLRSHQHCVACVLPPASAVSGPRRRRLREAAEEAVLLEGWQIG